MTKYDIYNIYEYYKNNNNKELSNKYKKYYVFATGCSVMCSFAKEFIETGIPNCFYSNKGDAYLTMGYFYFDDFEDFNESFKYFILSSEYDNGCSLYNVAVYYEYKNIVLNSVGNDNNLVVGNNNNLVVGNNNLVVGSNNNSVVGSNNNLVDVGDENILSNSRNNYKNRQNLLEYLIKAVSQGNIFAISKFVILNKLEHFKDCSNYNTDVIMASLPITAYYYIGCYFEDKSDYYNTLKTTPLTIKNKKTGNNDLDNAIMFFEIASNKKHYTSTLKLAIIYRNLKEMKQMVELCKILIEQNNIEAMTMMAEYHKSKRQYKQMEKYLKMLSDNNDVSALFKLAKQYLLKGNEKKMIECYEKASNLGHYFSQYELEKYYIEKKNMEKLVKLYENFYSNTEIYEFYSNLEKCNLSIMCPITLLNVDYCFRTKCNHEFSYDLLLINGKACPLCRATLY